MVEYITGGSGFIGSQLLNRLPENTVKIPYNEIATRDYQDFDKFFFLSGYGNMAHHTSKEKILSANILDLGRVLQYILHFDLNFRSFVYASSSSVGLDVQTPYSRSKMASEQMILSTGLPICIVRPFSVTGVGEQKEHLIPKLIRSCLEGTPMDFVPNAVHDYVDVEDVVDGMLMLAEQRATGVFELGQGECVTNGTVLNMVQLACGKQANIHVVKNMRTYDSLDWYCTNYRARDYGWRPKKTLAQSISEMVEAYKMKPDAAVAMNAGRIWGTDLDGNKHAVGITVGDLKSLLDNYDNEVEVCMVVCTKKNWNGGGLTGKLKEAELGIPSQLWLKGTVLDESKE